jgi:hypothetical protein
MKVEGDCTDCESSDLDLQPPNDQLWGVDEWIPISCIEETSYLAVEVGQNSCRYPWVFRVFR